MKQYLDLLRHIRENGTMKSDRTGTGTQSVFGYQMRYDLSEGFPLLTTKKVHLKSIIYELLWFIAGDTNIKYLKDNGVTIWDEWEVDFDGVYRQDGSNRIIGKEFAGTIGTAYGWITKKFGWPQKTIETIKNKPNDRRNIIDLWQPEYFDTAVERHELLKSQNNVDIGDNRSPSNRRGNVRLGDNLLQKGRYYYHPSLYVKTQRTDRRVM